MSLETIIGDVVGSGGASLAVLIPAPTVSTGVSGSRSLGFAAGAVQTNYVDTLGGATNYTINTAGGAPGQKIGLKIKGPYAWSLGSAEAIAFPNGFVPQPQCTATAYDSVALELQSDGSLACYVAGLGMLAAALLISPFAGATYAGQSVPVVGTYFGSAPANLDYTLDGSTFTTLASGAATITGGAFSFSISAPAAGTYPNFAVRATGTGELSAAQALTISPAAKPSGIAMSVAPGNGQVVVTGSANNNGASITSVPIYRGAAPGAESATAIGSASITVSGSTSSYIFTDPAAANGTKYYYVANPANSVGSEYASVAAAAAGQEVSCTPAPSGFTTASTTTFTAASAASSWGNGWIDNGGYSSILASGGGQGTLSPNTANSTPCVQRPSPEAVLNSQMTVNMPAGQTSSELLFLLLRYNNSSDLGYEFQFSPSSGNFIFYANGNGGVSGTYGTFTYNGAHAYQIVAAAEGSNPTMLSATIMDTTTGTAVGSFSGVADTTAACQTAGVMGLRNGSGNSSGLGFTSVVTSTHG